MNYKYVIILFCGIPSLHAAQLAMKKMCISQEQRQRKLEHLSVEIKEKYPQAYKQNAIYTWLSEGVLYKDLGEYESKDGLWYECNWSCIDACVFEDKGCPLLLCLGRKKSQMAWTSEEEENPTSTPSTIERGPENWYLSVRIFDLQDEEPAVLEQDLLDITHNPVCPAYFGLGAGICTSNSSFVFDLKEYEFVEIKHQKN